VNVGQVTTLFRNYIDEPDESFVSDATVQVSLAVAYEEFRHTVMQYDPQKYETSVSITVSGTTYDLGEGASAVSILGTDANLTHPRLIKLNNIASISASGAITRVWRSYGSIQALQRATDGYTLQNATLHFASTVAATLKVYYVPDAAYNAALSSGIDWSTAATYIDDLAPFHDMIALYAAQQYNVLDGASAEPQQLLLGQREVKLMEYLNFRQGPANQYVQRVLDEGCCA